jgi:hypothetical protein
MHQDSSAVAQEELFLQNLEETESECKKADKKKDKKASRKEEEILKNNDTGTN